MSSTVKITPDVRAVLEQVECSGNHVRIVEKLDRALYTKVAKILTLLGGTWNRKAGATVFDDGDDARSAIADALDAGAVVDLKKLFQAYPTSPALARRLVALACEVVDPGCKACLEPSAGTGPIARAAADVGFSVSFCEVQQSLIAALRGEGFSLLRSDFLMGTPEPAFHAVIANPPFSRGQDVMHVSRMLECVRPGGVVVTVMSPAWRFRTTALHTKFRERIATLDADWIELPEGSFAAAGTNVSTGILRVVMP